MFKLFQIGVFLSFLFASFNAVASYDPYGSCIKGYDFGLNAVENITIAPVSTTCQNMCSNECNSFSRKSSAGIELNRATILDCISSCQDGVVYSGYYYEEKLTENDQAKKVVMGPVATKVACLGTDKFQSSVYSSEMVVNPGDQIKLTLVSSNLENKIYSCGRKAINLDPMIKSLNSKVWSDNTPPQTALQSRNENLCAILMSDSKWANITNRELWTLKSTEFCDWSARNELFTNTGIWVKDGDELSISWENNYMFWPSYVDAVTDKKIPEEVRYSRAYLYKLVNDRNFKYSATIATILNKQSSLQFLKPEANPSDQKSPYIELNGEDARIFQLGEAYDPKKTKPENLPSGVHWYGLTGSVVDTNYKITPIKEGSACDSEEKRLKNYRICSIIADPGIPVYMFKGILNGFSKTPSLIALRHYDTAENDSYFSDNLGGSNVVIEWGGCPHRDGEMLQYAIAPTLPDGNSTLWVDVPENVFKKGEYININTKGRIFLRIKSVGLLNYNIPDDVQKYYTNQAYRTGQYYMNLSKLNKASFIFENGIIRKIVNSIRFTLYGDPSKPNDLGVLEKLYKTFVKESTVIGAIRSILLLYVALTGLGYLLGIIQLTHYDLIVRLFKLTFVAAIISPTSWEFFSNNFFKLFMDGGLELIGDIASGSFDGNIGFNIDLKSDPANIFAVFDGPFKILFSKQTWLKILALSMTGMLGIVLAMVIVIAAIFYFLALAKATLMFLMSLVIIALLIFIAPIFLCFMLFSMTKGMFDIWWKFLISFTFQPIAVFTSVAIFSMLIIISLYNALGFSICPSCLFAIEIPSIVDFCLIPTWRILAFSHFPEGASFSYLPGDIVRSSLIFLILTQGMYVFCEFIALVVNRIVTGHVINETSLKAYGEGGLDLVRTVFGVDDQSRRRRYYKNQQEANKAPNDNTRARQ